MLPYSFSVLPSGTTLSVVSMAVSAFPCPVPPGPAGIAGLSRLRTGLSADIIYIIFVFLFYFTLISDEDPVAVVDLVLDDLRGPPGEPPALLLPAAVQVLHLDILISGRLPDAVQRQAPFLGLERRVLSDDDRIIHDQVQHAHIDHDDPFPHADHVGRHADAAVTVGLQGVQEVLPDGQVLFRRFLRLLAEEERVSDDGSYHVFLHPSVPLALHPITL